MLVLTTYDARVFTSVLKLERLVAEGQVRYAFLNTLCTHEAATVNPACAAPVKWVRTHGTDISIKAGLPQGGLLYLLPGAKPLPERSQRLSEAGAWSETNAGSEAVSG